MEGMTKLGLGTVLAIGTLFSLASLGHADSRNCCSVADFTITADQKTNTCTATANWDSSLQSNHFLATPLILLARA
jgi:hypothetical protein